MLLPDEAAGEHHVTLWRGDRATYARALALVRGATSSLRFETFNFYGAIASGLAHALADAARRGVRVEALLDAKSMQIGNQAQLARHMHEAGAQVRRYDVHQLRRPWLGVDHAKLLVVDGRAGLVGGTNFSKDFNEDLNIEFEGPALSALERKFDQGWRFAKSPVSAPPGELGPLEPDPGPSEPLAILDGLGVTITETRPLRAEPVAPPTREATLAAIRSSQTSIEALMYILDDAEIVRALAGAHARGVAVRLVLQDPDAPSGPFAQLNRIGLKGLLAAGVPVRLYAAPPEIHQLHAKVAIFDGERVVGGSTNWMTAAGDGFNEVGFWLGSAAAAPVRLVFEEVWERHSRVAPSRPTAGALTMAMLGGLARVL